LPRKGRMVFCINASGKSDDPRYATYPAYYISIYEENDKGSYDYKGSWYITEDNFLNTLLLILEHEKEVNGIRKREPQYPKLIQKIREMQLHEFLE